MLILKSNHKTLQDKYDNLWAESNHLKTENLQLTQKNATSLLNNTTYLIWKNSLLNNVNKKKNSTVF